MVVCWTSKNWLVVAVPTNVGSSVSLLFFATNRMGRLGRLTSSLVHSSVERSSGKKSYYKVVCVRVVRGKARIVMVGAEVVLPLGDNFTRHDTCVCTSRVTYMYVFLNRAILDVVRKTARNEARASSSRARLPSRRTELLAIAIEDQGDTAESGTDSLFSVDAAHALPRRVSSSSCSS